NRFEDMHMCKKYIFVLFSLALPFLFACSKEDRPYFEARYEARFDLPASLNTLETHYFLIKDVPTFFNQNITSRGWTEESVEKIEASRGVLRSTFGSIDFEFIEDISIFAI